MAKLPAALRENPQWVGHRRKQPINPHTGARADVTAPATWGTLEQALAAVKRYRLDGVGIVLGGGLLGIDLDGCRHPETGALEPWAAAIVARLPMLYWEASPSGRGLHGIGYGQLPPGRRRRGPIETYDAGRFFTVTGATLPGHETPGSPGEALTAWHGETFPPEPAPTPPPGEAFTAGDDAEILERLMGERSGKAGRLLAGDTSGYPSPSEARAALAWKCAYYTTDAEQVARIVRSSDLFTAGTPDRERDRKAARDAAEALRTYRGETYQPAPAHPPKGRPAGPIQHHAFDRGSETHDTPDAGETCAAQLAAARAEIAQLKATVAQQASTIEALRTRARLADEREAIQRNTKLGAARQTGAALASLFRAERPSTAAERPDVVPDTTPYRMPLDRLADRTGQSADTCSKHLRKLAEYRTPEGLPVLHVETVDIPRKVNQSTGEVIEPHREVWVGPGVEPDAFGYILAALTPGNAPKHGGKPDRNVCPDHPHAGTIRRTRTIRKITRECAECHTVLEALEVPVGKPTAEFIYVAAPIQQDAFGADPPTRPIRQDARTMGNHTGGRDLSGKMRHSSPLDSEPPDSWTPPPDAYTAYPGSSYPGSAGADRWTE